jgi:hypothetical protein
MIRDASPEGHPGSGALPSLVHPHRSPTSRLDKPVIEGQETQVGEPLRKPHALPAPGHEFVEETVLFDRYRVEARLAEGAQSGTAVSQEVDWS